MSATKIRGAAIFDGEKVIERGELCFENGVIVESAANAAIIDGAGKTILPAFIDSHVHLYEESNLREAAKFGVGFMCDMAVRSPEAVNALRNLSGLPRILSPNCPGFAPGSKMPTDLKYPESCWVRDVADAVRFVDEQIADGADYIKVILEEPKVKGQVAFPPEVLSAIVTAAHERGKRVIAHSVSPAHFDLCSNVGVDVITHIPFFKVLSGETIALLAQKQPMFVPTMGVMRGIVRKLKLKMPFLPFGYKFVRQTVGLLRRAGLTCLVGTDSNMGDKTTPQAMPYGKSLHKELALMVDAGYTPLEVLQLATSKPADYWGLTDCGLLKPGYRADLVLVNGNPLKDIKAVRKIDRVWLGGVEVKK